MVPGCLSSRPEHGGDPGIAGHLVDQRGVLGVAIADEESKRRDAGTSRRSMIRLRMAWCAAQKVIGAAQAAYRYSLIKPPRMGVRCGLRSVRS